MKINTIGTYILVYLLTCVLFNVLVSAKSTVDQTGYSSQPSETYPVYSQTSTPKTGVGINISSDTKSTGKFDYKKVGQYVTYNPKENEAFKLVKDDNIQLWKATDPSEYCDKVEVDLMNNYAKAVTVCLGNENKVFMKTGNNELWNEFDISKVTRSAININYEHETYFYTNELVGNVRTFTAKKGFGFKGANEFINEKKVTIWMTNNKSEYANKIVNEKGDKLTIHIGEGAGATTKVYNKGSDGNWTEDKPDVGAELTLPTPQDKLTTTQPKVKLLKVNPSDPDSLMELDANEYTCTSNPSVALYQIDESVNCVKMMIDDAVLWVYDSKYQGGIYPRSLEYHAVTDTLILRFEGHYIIFENTDGGWISTESGPLEVKFHVADKKDPNNTVQLTDDQFTVAENRDITTFNIADCVNCIALTYGPVVLWEHDANKQSGNHPKSSYYIKSTDTLVLKI
ncbi:hypothetical protein MACJ_000009 [Theileria orientalis]|uniref:SfiI-subtelomeric related protein family member n=1 Tax=Theileria orientalis TaxID=68886 RepID=A0A976M3C6_THEOR|nr:hypothetical protein MACJ_000009 [Theileria orientalis]